MPIATESQGSRNSRCRRIRRHYFPFAFAVSCSGDNPPAFVSGSFGSWSTKALSIKYVPSTVRAAAAIMADCTFAKFEFFGPYWRFAHFFTFSPSWRAEGKRELPPRP
jgi:hypothetical protein